ncbi:hypothetical protein QBC32DRAFT_351449, partial [Pseudoneurospora amorphoporcata]
MNTKSPINHHERYFARPPPTWLPCLSLLAFQSVCYVLCHYTEIISQAMFSENVLFIVLSFHAIFFVQPTVPPNLNGEVAQSRVRQWRNRVCPLLYPLSRIEPQGRNEM